MKFELGKYYRHVTGKKLFICGLATTYIYGCCLIGEDKNGNLSPIGISEDNAVNFYQITKEQFINNSIDDIVLETAVGLNLDLDGDILTLDGVKYYVHCLSGKVTVIESNE